MSELLLETPSQFIKWFNDTDSDYEIKFKHGLGHIQLSFQIDVEFALQHRRIKLKIPISPAQNYQRVRQSVSMSFK